MRGSETGFRNEKVLFLCSETEGDFEVICRIRAIYRIYDIGIRIQQYKIQDTGYIWLQYAAGNRMQNVAIRNKTEADFQQTQKWLYSSRDRTEVS